jgi:hypothetical protein
VDRRVRTGAVAPTITALYAGLVALLLLVFALRESAAANRRFDDFVRELSRFNRRFGDSK